ncbi:MAG: electron transport complex subunit RsxG [gamma proteobacterium symbiont of Phacoides pectinatus]
MTESPEPKYRKHISYQAILLGGFATLAAILLVSANLATSDTIAERQKEDLLASLNQVMPPAWYDNDLLQNPLHVSRPNGRALKIYRGFKESQVSTLAWEISEQGYAGEIRMIMGIDSACNILGVRVVAHAETPGLGDKIEPEKDDWITRFNGLSLNNPPVDQWKVKKDGGHFDSFSGATITPRAVVKGIHKGLEFYQNNRSRLLALPEDAVSSETIPINLNPGDKP